MAVEEHLVGFGTAIDLEENKPGYSEIGTDLPSGTCIYNETRINRDGDRYLVVPDRGGYEARKRAFLGKRLSTSRLPDWLKEKLKKYEGKGLNYWSLAAKFRDGFSRREVVKKLKEAKTKEEKIAILEEFHKEAIQSRKYTALKLKCMEATRIIRQEAKDKIPLSHRTYRTRDI